MSACAGCGLDRSMKPLPSMASPICAARRSSCRPCSTRPRRSVAPSRITSVSIPRPPAARRGTRRHDRSRLLGQSFYGLTETYGPAVVNEWKGRGRARSAGTYRHEGAPGCALIPRWRSWRFSILDDAADAADGQTIGEVMFRGNIVMKGYLKNPAASARAFAGGWFHSGDLGVMHPDGYLQIKDRSKDIIISGGRTFPPSRWRMRSTGTPQLRPARSWRWRMRNGRIALAFVELKPGAQATEEEIIAHCRERLARFKCPKKVTISSPVCRAPRPARSRNSCCGKWPGRNRPYCGAPSGAAWSGSSRSFIRMPSLRSRAMTRIGVWRIWRSRSKARVSAT